MIYKQSYHIISICTMFSITHSIHADFMNSVCSMLGGKPYESVIEKDYALENFGHISLKNMQGSIVVKIGLNKKTVAIRAVKHAAAQEHLDHMHIIEEKITPNQLHLRTAYDYEKVNGTVDYTLTIPENANIHISTDNGNITVSKVHGSITAITSLGDITVEQPADTVHATIAQQGNITIMQPKDAINVQTHKGNINIRDCMHNVHAHAISGRIDIKCKKLSAPQEIICSIDQGPISLYLPKDIQCSITADTPQGTVSSEQPITITSETTLLNNDYWNRIKKQLRGSIGNDQAKGSIKLYAQHGNIVLR